MGCFNPHEPSRLIAPIEGDSSLAAEIQVSILMSLQGSLRRGAVFVQVYMPVSILMSLQGSLRRPEQNLDF